MQTVQEQILSVNFNQDQTMFAVGTDRGFKVMTTENLECKFYRDLKGGIGLVEMLYRSNIFALVGGGLQPKYPDTKVIMWDDNLNKGIGEMSFRDKIRNVKLKNDKVVVVVEKKVFVYNFSDLKLLDQIETYQNVKGICAINVEGDYTILAVPDKLVGRVLIAHIGKNTLQIAAHQSPISFLALTQDGRKLATTSEKGTVIRVYDSESGTLIQEVRRGTDYAAITSLAFNMNATYLACASDQGTIHIFGLKGTADDKDTEQTKNATSKFAILGSIIPILKSEWSFAQFRTMDNQCKVSFLDHNTFVAISAKGKYYKAQFDIEKGGECIRLKESDIMEERQTSKEII